MSMTRNPNENSGITRSQAVRIWQICGNARRALDENDVDRASDCICGIESWIATQLGGVYSNEMHRDLIRTEDKWWHEET